MNDAAISEAVLCEAVLHDSVVSVRIYTDIAFLSEAPVEQVFHYPVVVRQTSYSMNDVVSSLVEPFAIVDNCVRRLRPIHVAMGLPHTKSR